MEIYWIEDGGKGGGEFEQEGVGSHCFQIHNSQSDSFKLQQKSIWETKNPGKGAQTPWNDAIIPKERIRFLVTHGRRSKRNQINIFHTRNW
jgi:hypothetical protein